LQHLHSFIALIVTKLDCLSTHGKMLADSLAERAFTEDWAVVAKKLGVSEVLPHARANPRARHYTEYYTPETQNYN